MQDKFRVWGQGSLRLFSPLELFAALSSRRFTGRLVLMSASTPRKVLALHLDEGHPALVVGTGLHRSGSTIEQTYRARQSLLDALTWTVGSFRVEPLARALPENTAVQPLGTVENIVRGARERAESWSNIITRLPAAYEDVAVVPSPLTVLPDDPVQQAVLQVLEREMMMPEVGLRCRVDEHLALEAVVGLADSGAVRLTSTGEEEVRVSPNVAKLARQLTMALAPSETSGNVFKITVLSWDSRTCFLTVEALLGRNGKPPAGIEEQPRFQILHEDVGLGEGLHLEVLAFRHDVFEPALAAPLVQNCHLFLLVTDVDAGHVWGAERPLVDRIEEIRGMFTQAAAAARITVGAGAVTDPGCDVLIPELARFASWDEVESSEFLSGVLSELRNRLGELPGAASGPSPAVS